MRIRYRWHGELDEAPAIGGYLLSTAARPRHGYLITGVRNAGLRGALPRPPDAPMHTDFLHDHYLLIIEAEHVDVDTARQGPTWSIEWDKREKRRRPVATPAQRL